MAKGKHKGPWITPRNFVVLDKYMTYLQNRQANIECDADVTAWLWHWFDICIDPREV